MKLRAREEKGGGEEGSHPTPMNTSFILAMPQLESFFHVFFILLVVIVVVVVAIEDGMESDHRARISPALPMFTAHIAESTRPISPTLFSHGSTHATLLPDPPEIPPPFVPLVLWNEPTWRTRL